MTYMGSKRRIAKHILPVILKDRKEGQYYVEPFVGGGNMIDNVDGLRIGADGSINTIMALETIRDHIDKIPKNNKEFTEEMYNEAKRISKTESRRGISYIGFAYSFGAKWFGGWCRNKEGKDYVSMAYRGALKQHPRLQGVKLIHSKYENLNIPSNSIIYCDPPYKGTTGYNTGLDYEHFYNWCRDKSKEGHTIFISEYNMPEDFECVWEMKVTCNLDSRSKTLNKVEKLFTIKELI